MKVVVDVPEIPSVEFPSRDVLARELLEAYVVRRYRQGTLTEQQVGEVLGLDRGSTDALLWLDEAFQP